MPRNKLKPRVPKPMGAVVSVRLGEELRAAVQKRCGDLDESTWIRDVTRRALETPESEAIRETREYMARRGVTIEMLVNDEKNR